MPTSILKTRFLLTRMSTPELIIFFAQLEHETCDSNRTLLTRGAQMLLFLDSKSLYFKSLASLNRISLSIFNVAIKNLSLFSGTLCRRPFSKLNVINSADFEAYVANNPNNRAPLSNLPVNNYYLIE